MCFAAQVDNFQSFVITKPKKQTSFSQPSWYHQCDDNIVRAGNETFVVYSSSLANFGADARD